MMKLNETVKMMNSADYKERFQAEYNQLAIRYYGLKNMLEKWDAGTLSFKPTCPRSTYNMQIKAMTDYLAVLEARAVMEGIKLSDVNLLLHRKNQVLFMIPGPPYSYCFFCFFFAALFQFVQSSPVYNAFPFTLSCLRTFWISSLPFLSAAIHKGL